MCTVKWLIVTASLTTVGGSNAHPDLTPTVVAATPNTVEGSDAHPDMTPAAVTYLSTMGARVDAVMTIEGNVGPSYQHHMAYIFTGSQYIKWNLQTDSLYSGPRDISSGFGGHVSHVDAVMTIEGNVGPSYQHDIAYIFTGNQYIKWNLQTDSFYSGPKDISSGFAGIPTDVEAVEMASVPSTGVLMSVASVAGMLVGAAAFLVLKRRDQTDYSLIEA